MPSSSAIAFDKYEEEAAAYDRAPAGRSGAAVCRTADADSYRGARVGLNHIMKRNIAKTQINAKNLCAPLASPSLPTSPGGPSSVEVGGL